MTTPPTCDKSTGKLTALMFNRVLTCSPRCMDIGCFNTLLDPAIRLFRSGCPGPHLA